MITVKVLLGKDTVSIYRKTGDISSVESTAESGGYVITRHFETEAEYRKEMILEVIAWCRYEGTWIIEVRDIREDDTQEFDAVFLRPLTARDLVAISAPRHPLSTAIYPIHIR